MFIHDIIKIKYTREGFLPDYPYHLISDEEMCNAFLSDDHECYFYDSYPCIDNSLKPMYMNLIDEIKYHISVFLDSSNDIDKLPIWVYSYMLGAVIGPNSDLYDIHDVLVMMNLDNVEDDITVAAYNEMYKISCQYIRKLSEEEKEHRPPTIFGEPHVIKILRLEQAQI